MEGFSRIADVYATIFVVAYEGFDSEKEAYGVIRKGTVGHGVQVKDQKFYKLLARMDRELDRVAEKYESLMDKQEIHTFCELCGDPIFGNDGTQRMHIGCRRRVEELVREIKSQDQGW
jgi:NADH pyrophosphatase NudC (nudix superfamily)